MPWWLPLAMTGVGLASNWIGNATNRGPQDQTANWLNQFNAANGFDPNNRDLNAGRSNQFWNMFTGSGSMNPSGWLGGAQSFNNMAQGALGDAVNSANRSAGDIWASFAKTQPAMSAWATGVSSDAMMNNGAAAEAYARRASSDATRAIENNLARSGAFGTVNGAALSALAEGAANPLLQIERDLAAMRNSAYMNAFMPMANAGYGRELGRTNEYLNLVSGALNGMNTMGGIGLNLANLMAPQAEQMFLAPDLVYQPNMWQTLGGALLGTGAQGLGGMTVPGSPAPGTWQYNTYDYGVTPSLLSNRGLQ